MLPIRRRAAAGQQYAIVVGLIAVLALLAVTQLGGGVSQLMTRTSNSLSGVIGNTVVVAPPPPAPVVDLAISGSNSGMNVTGPGNPAYGTPVVFTVVNNGTLTSATPTPNLVSANFSITGTTCSAPLAPAASCTVTVRPQATADGGLSAVLSIPANNAPSLALTGTASNFSGALASCQAWLTAGYTSDGNYLLDPDGAGSSPATTVACVMTVDSGGWTKIYDLNIPVASDYNVPADVLYSVNNSALPFTYSRVAYRFTGNSTYAWTSMDDFTGGNRTRLGVPVDWTYQQNVTNMNVISNSGAITGTFGTVGRLEFWSHCYDPTASAGLSGSSTLYDFDDTIYGSPDCHASMQVHEVNGLIPRRYTVWAYNAWSSGSTNADIGFGNNTTSCGGAVHPDWTFCYNAASYSTRRLEVFIR